MISSAQVTIATQLPPAGFVQKDQLWNLILVNNKDEVLDVNIRMNVQDASNGQSVLTATSGKLIIGKGVKPVTVNDLQPINYNYNVQDFMRTALPLGSYVICYQIVGGIAGKELPLGEECIRLNIEPLSPPLLNFPANESILNETYPPFSWIPPAPFEMFNNLNYDLLVTEVLPGQQPSEAINNNSPIYFKANLLQPFDIYSSSYNKLDTGKTYAWQVIAKNGINYSSKTSVWTFSVKNNLIEQAVLPKGEGYLLMRDDIQEVYTIKDDVLKIKYYSFTPTFSANVSISDSKLNLLQQQQYMIVNGENYIELTLKQSIKKGVIYSAGFVDQNNSSHTVKFIVQ